MNSPRPLLGFCGRAGAGKSTAAGALVTTCGYHRLSFADPIRDMFRALGLTTEDFGARKEMPHPLLCGRSPRYAMQTLGTEWGRQRIGQNLWLDLARHRATVALRTGPVAFDDVRFDNEAQLIRDLGGRVILLERPGHRSIGSTHASEAGISPALIDAAICAEDVPSLHTQLFARLNLATAACS